MRVEFHRWLRRETHLESWPGGEQVQLEAKGSWSEETLWKIRVCAGPVPDL